MAFHIERIIVHFKEQFLTIDVERAKVMLGIGIVFGVERIECCDRLSYAGDKVMPIIGNATGHDNCAVCL